MDLETGYIFVCMSIGVSVFECVYVLLCERERDLSYLGRCWLGVCCPLWCAIRAKEQRERGERGKTTLVCVRVVVCVLLCVAVVVVAWLVFPP